MATATPTPTKTDTCGLTLRIRETNYRVIPLGITNGCRAFKLRRLDNGTAYTCRESNAGLSCTCPDFTARRRGRSGCKHLRALLALQMIGIF